MDTKAQLLEQVRARRWFYEFDLPDGTRTRAQVPAGVERIHTTRQIMIDLVLDRTLGPDASTLTALDLACHQGWFSMNLARRGFSEVLAVDGRQEHLEDARLMAEVLGVTTLRTLRLDLEEARVEDIGVHDVTLMLGLLYHLENPVRALRLARAATRRFLIIETQVVPHVAGKVEWGSTQFLRELKGIFGILDEPTRSRVPRRAFTASASRRACPPSPGCCCAWASRACCACTRPRTVTSSSCAAAARCSSRLWKKMGSGKIPVPHDPVQPRRAFRPRPISRKPWTPS